jgi:flagellar assembly factor FliW
MKINTSRFGEIEVDRQSVVDMPEGMLGFAEFKQFVLIRHTEGSPFLWYQAVDEPNLAFVMIDPFIFFPDYEVVLAREDLDALEVEELGSLAVFSVVVIPENPEDMTANLRGPVLINVEKRIARQVVLNDERYSPHQPILETVRGAVERLTHLGGYGCACLEDGPARRGSKAPCEERSASDMTSAGRSDCGCE